MQRRRKILSDNRRNKKRRAKSLVKDLLALQAVKHHPIPSDDEMKEAVTLARDFPKGICAGPVTLGWVGKKLLELAVKGIAALESIIPPSFGYQWANLAICEGAGREERVKGHNRAPRRG